MTNDLTARHRLLSLDVMRGCIMILLAGESCMVYESLHHAELPAPLSNLIQQFFHHPWNGLRFWDLIQPSFMTMAGTALYISWRNREAKGVGWAENFRHVAIRCFKLFLCGTALHCVYAGKLVWELWNVLTQLSVTTILAYLVIRKSSTVQIVYSLGLLLLTELLYRFTNVPGYDQPFVDHKNFGAFMDMVLMGKINEGGWVTINFIPTAAHTIWGVVAGKLLMGDLPPQKKIQRLLIAGLLGLAIGFGMDWTGITPIIKRIATTSFVFASAGWVFLILAFVYWLVDIKKVNKYAWIAAVVGMNSIFIYLFFETVGSQWVDGAVGIFVKGFTGLAGAPEKLQTVLSALVTWFLEWGLCYWLYKKAIFFKL